MDDDRRAAERAEDAALVTRARGEDPDAFGRLYDRWFTRVHDLAFRIVHDDAAAADVAQDAFVSAWKNLATLETPEAFGGWLLRIARNAALDRKRRDARATPLDDEGLAVIESAGPSPASAPAGFRVEDRTRTADDPSHAVEDNELVALVWESAAALGERDAEILDLGLRHGLTPAEIGEAVGLNRNAANQAVHRVRNRLKTAVEARVLWRSGEPVCEGLTAALVAADVKHFGPEAVKVTTRHAEKCAECQERRELQLEPSAMFGALPFLVVPLLLRMKVAHALTESGVPMGESEAATGTDPEENPLHGRRRVRPRLLVGAVVVAVLAFGSVAAFASDVQEAKIKAVAATVTTTTLAGTTDTTAATAPTDVTTVPTTVKTTVTTIPKGIVSPPLPPPPPPPPTSPPTSPPTAPPETGTASITVRPSGRTGVVVWSSTGGASWSATGSGVSSASRSGSQSVTWTAPGSYTYTMTTYGTSGQVLASNSTSVTI